MKTIGVNTRYFIGQNTRYFIGQKSMRPIA